MNRLSRLQLFSPPIFLVLVTCLAFIVRFYHLSTNPPSLNLDEVAIGYNAYSILKTGRDEYGFYLPIAFRSHDDYKAPLYIYLTTFPIALFSLTPFAVRFTSALVGTFSIPLFYLTIQQLFIKSKHLPLLCGFAAMLLTISPWHLQFSRAAFETNLALFLVLLGFWAYLKGKTKPHYWFLTAIAFALSLYAYHSTKFFIPVFSLVLAYNSRRQIKKNIKTSFISTTLFICLIIPLIPFSLSPQGRLRFKGTNVFNTPTLVTSNHAQKIDQWRQGRQLEAFLFHDEKFAACLTILKGFFSHFTFHLLFLGENGPPRNLTPNVGLLYLWELPFVISGFYALFKLAPPIRLPLLSWLLLAPIPSSLTWDAPSSTRTLLLLPVFIIMTSLGLVSFITTLFRKYKKTPPIRHTLYAILIIIPLFFFLHYLHNYYRIAPINYADSWQYGYQQAVAYTQDHLDEYAAVYVSTNLNQPHNFFAFYSQYDPYTYIHADGGTVSGGFNESHNRFGKYIFTPIDWSDQALREDALYIDLADKTPDHLSPVKKIYLPDGTPKIFIIKKNPAPWEIDNS